MKKFMKKIKRKFLRRLFNTCLVLGLTLFLSGVPSFAAEKVYFYHTDAAGTPMAMTDSSGNVVWEADYKPFGEEQEVTAFPENNKRFIGKEKDEETGLYYFGARYMDAGIGRFTKPDPVGITEADLLNPQRFNRYNYSLNNPYRYVDPDGNTVWDIADIGFFGYSLYKFISNPSWSTAGDLALDAVGLAPLVPSIGSIKLVGKGLSKAGKAGKVARGAINAPVTLTKKGERFVRVAPSPEGLKFTFRTPGGVPSGTYAVPEEVFNRIGRTPAKLKDILDLPGPPPKFYRTIEPPLGTKIQRGVVPGKQFGGRGGVPEVYFPEGF